MLFPISGVSVLLDIATLSSGSFMIFFNHFMLEMNFSNRVERV